MRMETYKQQLAGISFYTMEHYVKTCTGLESQLHDHEFYKMGFLTSSLVDHT